MHAPLSCWYTIKWLDLPPALSSVALYSSTSTSLRLPLRSIIEKYKLSKIRTQWMLNNSADSRIREVKPLLRSRRKFRISSRADDRGSERSYPDMQLDGTICQNGPRRAHHSEPGRRRKVEQDRGRFSNHSRVSGHRGKT